MSSCACGGVPKPPLADVAVDGEQMEVAQAEAAKIEASYDTERLKSLIAAHGWANA